MRQDVGLLGFLEKLLLLVHERQVNNEVNCQLHICSDVLQKLLITLICRQPHKFKIDFILKIGKVGFQQLLAHVHVLAFEQ